jgi:hypothetical protein
VIGSLRTAGVVIAFGACAVLAPGAIAQAPGADPDRCPGLEGTVSGCPDSDDDGIADLDDRCPTLGDRISPDYFIDGCPDAVYSVRYSFRARVTCAGRFRRCVRSLRLTRLRLIHIAGYGQVRAQTVVRCQLKSGRSCGAGPTYPAGTRFVMAVKSPSAPDAGTIECHQVNIGRNSANLSSFRGPDAVGPLGANCEGLLR